MKLSNKLGGDVIAVVPQGKKRKGKKDSSGAGTSKQMAMLINDFGIEYSKSGRATCAGCHLKISKDEVRIKKTVHDTEVGMKYGGQAIWHHVECFAQIRSELGWFASAEILPGFKSLSKDDQQAAKKHIPAIKQDIDEPSVKKPKIDKAETELDAKIEKQNKEYYKLRDTLEKETKKSIQISILEAMNQAIPEGNAEVKIFTSYITNTLHIS